MPNASDPLLERLLQEGGAVVRWLTLTQILDHPGKAQVRRAQCDLLDSPHVRLWLERLDGVKAFHNSGNDCFENVAGKLGEFGLRAGIEPLDARIARFLDWISRDERKRKRGMMATLNRVIACAGLLRLGYTQPKAIRDFALMRLDQIHDVAASSRYDIYLPDDPPDVPKACRGRHRVVRPEFTPEGACRLPYIHDLYILANMPPQWKNASVQRKIDAVVRYVLADEYQRLPRGYGYLRDDTGGRPKYYVLGWDVHLPSHDSGREQACFIQRWELMSCFAAARRSPWWAAATARLESMRMPEGDYLFPPQWLQEKPVGYWVTGSHMGLESDRRSGRTRRSESTLRALRALRHRSR